MISVQLIKIGGNSIGLIIPKHEVLYKGFKPKQWVKFNIEVDNKKNDI